MSEVYIVDYLHNDVYDIIAVCSDRSFAAQCLCLVKERNPKYKNFYSITQMTLNKLYDSNKDVSNENTSD